MTTRRNHPRPRKISAAVERQIAEIAKTHLSIETLEPRNLDRLDFHDIGVVGLKQALLAAYEAGRQAAAQKS